MEKMYSVKEVAELYRVSPKTVYMWISQGKMPVVRTPGKGRVYVPASWIEKQLGGVDNERER